MVFQASLGLRGNGCVGFLSEGLSALKHRIEELAASLPELLEKSGGAGERDGETETRMKVAHT